MASFTIAKNKIWINKGRIIALYFKQIFRELEKSFILKEFEVISDDKQKKIVVEDAIDILYNTETINHKLNEIIINEIIIAGKTISEG